MTKTTTMPERFADPGAVEFVHNVQQLPEKRRSEFLRVIKERNADGTDRREIARRLALALGRSQAEIANVSDGSIRVKGALG